MFIHRSCSSNVAGSNQAVQGAEGGEAEDYGAKAASSELKFVSLATVGEMLKVQESALRSVFESAVSSLSQRVDEVQKIISSIETSVQFSQTDIDEMKPLHGKISKINDEINKLGRDLSDQALKAKYLENQSRRNNIRVNGIAESEGETWEEAEAKVKEAVKTKLGVDLEIERAHRVGRRKKKQGDTNKPRTIVCRLSDWEQREQVLRKARREKATGLHINENLAFATIEKERAARTKDKSCQGGWEGRIFRLR